MEKMGQWGKVMEQWYTRRELAEAGLSLTSIDRWSKAFRDADGLVRKLPHKRYEYSAAFAHFVRHRQGKVGPANLPPVPLIAQIYALAQEYSPVQVAAILNKPLPVILEWYKELGL